MNLSPYKIRLWVQLKMKSDLLKEILEMLQEVDGDEYAPKNVRTKIRDIYSVLTKEGDAISIKVDRSLAELDDLNEDINIPIHIKTRLWDIVCKLESIPQ